MIRVFISSKQVELREDRLIVANVINGVRNMQAVLAEEWAPRREVVHQVYRKDVLRCPIYLGLFWRVFSEPTVAEYDAASSNPNSEILLYVKECAEEERDPRLRDLLHGFDDEHVPARYRSPAELMTVLPRHLDDAVVRMLERLLALGNTVRSPSGPRALAAERLLESWGFAGSLDDATSLLRDVREGIATMTC